MPEQECLDDAIGILRNHTEVVYYCLYLFERVDVYLWAIDFKKMAGLSSDIMNHSLINLNP